MWPPAGGGRGCAGCPAVALALWLPGPRDWGLRRAGASAISLAATLPLELIPFAKYRLPSPQQTRLPGRRVLASSDPQPAWPRQLFAGKPMFPVLPAGSLASHLLAPRCWPAALCCPALSPVHSPGQNAGGRLSRAPGGACGGGGEGEVVATVTTAMLGLVTLVSADQAARRSPWEMRQ